MDSTPPTEELRTLPIGLISPGPYQPRRRFDSAALEELAASIRQQGLIQPVIVRPVGGRFELIAGERRWRASQRAGLTEVPAIVRQYTDEQSLEAALVENLQREDISVVETARAYQRLTEEFRYTQGEIALRVGKSRPAVNNTLRLLQLPEEILTLLEEGEMTEGHARLLLMLPYASLQWEVAEWIVRDAVTVREAERRIKRLLSPEGSSAPGAVPPVHRDSHLRSLEDRLRQHFGTKVELDYRAGKGALRVEFYSDEDLERVLELLGIG